jgi:hypothetical protein
MIRLTQTFCWSHRFDEYHRFNVYFQELVGKHTILDCHFALSILEILVAFLQAYIFHCYQRFILVLQ